MIENKILLQSTRYGEFSIDKDKFIAEGGQGGVYKVSTKKGVYAVKWYNELWTARDKFRADLTHLIDIGPPDEPEGVGKRFLWPLDLVTDSSGGFGYLMDILEERFCESRDIRNPKKPEVVKPNLINLCQISFLLAHSFRALHLKGYCYKDISDRNILVDPKDGEILICDNDNVTVNNAGSAGVGGTLPFQAPEIILNQKFPSTLSDLYSLAVLLFHFWMWHHPMHGALEYSIPALDNDDRKNLYGKNPIFIFDPDNKSNRLPEGYRSVNKRWNTCPGSLKDLFIKSFTSGLHNPDARVTEGEWRSLFLKLKSGVTDCKICDAEVIVDLDDETKCWNCNEKLRLPPRLRFECDGSTDDIPLLKTTKIHPHHLRPRANESYEATHQIIGEIVENPGKPGQWGIRNKSEFAWEFTSEGGSAKQLPPGRAVPIKKNLKEIVIQGSRVSILP